MDGPKPRGHTEIEAAVGRVVLKFSALQNAVYHALSDLEFDVALIERKMPDPDYAPKLDKASDRILKAAEALRGKQDDRVERLRVLLKEVAGLADERARWAHGELSVGEKGLYFHSIYMSAGIMQKYTRATERAGQNAGMWKKLWAERQDQISRLYTVEEIERQAARMEACCGELRILTKSIRMGTEDEKAPASGPAGASETADGSPPTIR